MIDKRKRFKEIYPDKYFADGTDVVALASYLRSISFLKTSESINSTEVPGAGNMNYVLRVITNERTFIIKQSRPWVEKYPSIEAPIDRINIEAAYYTNLKDVVALTNASPDLLFLDADNFIMILEDLGDVRDYTHLYNRGAVISDEELESLAQYLAALHKIRTDNFPSNMEMRKLNHEHIYNYPYQSDNGFNLDDIQQGLSTLKVTESGNPELVSIIHQTGDLYLGGGEALLHGDFYPGSWMKSDKMYVLDPEFGFVGPREFDLGVFIAHMTMAQQKKESINKFLFIYKREYAFDEALAFRFAGVEILRRLLGVAQLPLPLTIEHKAKLISVAKEWIYGDEL